jgi:predicted CopG family antitoxin
MTLKTIKIDEVIYNKLLERKREHESIADVIARILNIQHGSRSKRTKRRC